VTRYLVDTNIIINVVKPVPSETLIDWMAEQIDENLFISALTIAEIRRRRAGKTSREEAPGIGGLALWSRRTTSPIRRPGAALR
jgi:predicted nucleic acid-binding protein